VPKEKTRLPHFVSSHYKCGIGFAKPCTPGAHVWNRSPHSGRFTPRPSQHPNRLWLGEKRQQPLMHPCQPETCLMRAVLQGPPSLFGASRQMFPPVGWALRVLINVTLIWSPFLLLTSLALLTVGGQASPALPFPVPTQPRSTRRRIVSPLFSNLQ